ncbi:MAG: carbohydrate binding family 9 domain-containing protein [Fidelibacterota bacterium]|nr:MAG: carbohydrate binding family 9 domain-containing protein [Candidatus Neomarinimicrobiota bacterium]
MTTSPISKKWLIYVCVAGACLASHSLVYGDPSAAQTQGHDGNPYPVPRIESRIKVDGILNESDWDKALVLELNYEFDPGDNVPAPVPTEVLLMNDGTQLYAAFRCYVDDASEIRAHLTDRENFWNDDHVNIHIDTFNDERRSYALGANPLGVQMDAIAADQNFDWSWDGIWASAGSIFDWGYIVELAIPFSQLRFQRTNGPQVWGFDAWRVHSRSVLHFIGAFPQDRDNSCWQCQMIKIEGFEGVTPGENLEISPTAIGGRTDTRDDLPDGSFDDGKLTSELGLTAKWGITTNLTASGTLNPDFSQVEADALQLDVNQPFALYYREKRPFFTEGADFFSTLKTAIYTRTMHDPSAGLKLTGKEGVHTIGGYVVRDEQTNLLFPGSQGSDSESLERASTASVLRYKRDFGSTYTFGALLTDREGKDYYNRLVGLDNHLRVTETDEIQLQYLESWTLYPDSIVEEYDQPGGSFQDRYIAFEYDHDSHNQYWWLDYDYVGDGLRADLGFIPRVGFQDVEGGYFYRWFAEPGKWWSRFTLGSDFNYYVDQSDQLLEKGASIWCSYQGFMQSYVNVNLHRSREAYDNAEFDLTSVEIFTQCRPFGDLGLNFFTRFGDRIDYDNTRKGERLLVNPWIEYNLGRHMNLTLDHAFERLNVEGGRLYTANVTQMSAVYQFNIRTFFRSIVQHVDYRYNTKLYTFEIDPEERYLFVQLLLSYKVNPQTVFFLGYSSNYTGTHEYNLAQEDRSIFLKMGYAWLR